MNDLVFPISVIQVKKLNLDISDVVCIDYHGTKRLYILISIMNVGYSEYQFIWVNTESETIHKTVYWRDEVMRGVAWIVKVFCATT